MISITMPVHNQADHIENIVEGYMTILQSLPSEFELVLALNACTDNSSKVCSRLAKKRPQVQVVESERAGWGHAVKLGLQATKGDVLCYTNSARTSPEILALTLKQALANPNSVIKANRKVKENFRRRLGSLLYNLECRALFDSPVWDINGTPKVFPRKFGALLNLSREDDLIDAEFVAICRKNNYPILEIPVHSIRRHGGRSTTNYYSAFKMYMGAYQLWRQLKKAELS